VHETGGDRKYLKIIGGTLVVIGGAGAMVTLPELIPALPVRASVR